MGRRQSSSPIAWSPGSRGCLGDVYSDGVPGRVVRRCAGDCYQDCLGPHAAPGSLGGDSGTGNPLGRLDRFGHLAVCAEAGKGYYSPPGNRFFGGNMPVACTVPAGSSGSSGICLHIIALIAF